MTTVTQRRPRKTPPQPPPYRPGAIAIPLAEFGQSLDDPNLSRWLEAFSARNDNKGQFEISKEGCLLLMAPTGSPGVLFEGELLTDLSNWARENNGIAYGPTSLFILPDGSYLGPDAAWLREERRREIILPENLPFPRIVPDFIAEIKSPSNTQAELLSKIASFIQHGARLAWYIDPETRTVIIFRPSQEPETLHNPEHIVADAAVLPGFRFPVQQRIFNLFPNTPP